MSASKTIFITGASGFLGQRLLADLLEQTDSQFALLVRSDDARQRLASAIGSADRKRIRFIHGNVRQADFGIDSETLALLRKSVHEIWHLAASTNFEESKRDETCCINICGTNYLLRLAERFPHLDTLFFMSTAYVWGRQSGRVPEGPFDTPPEFRNPYEQSKYQAEQLVWESDLPVAILRPSIIMGDSTSGECGGETRMMYGFAYAILRAAMHVFGSSAAYWQHWQNGNGHPEQYPDVSARLSAATDATKNMVTVDDVVSACLAIRQSLHPAGKVYHIVNPTDLTCGQVITALMRVMKLKGYRLDPALTETPLKSASIVERAAFRSTRLFHPYTLVGDPCWETNNLDRLEVPRVEMSPSLFEFLMASFVRSLVPAS